MGVVSSVQGVLCVMGATLTCTHVLGAIHPHQPPSLRSRVHNGWADRCDFHNPSPQISVDGGTSGKFRVSASAPAEHTGASRDDFTRSLFATPWPARPVHSAGSDATRTARRPLICRALTSCSVRTCRGARHSHAAGGCSRSSTSFLQGLHWRPCESLRSWSPRRNLSSALSIFEAIARASFRIANDRCRKWRIQPASI